MNIVEFVEEFLDVKLLDFQEKFLTDLYAIYEKDPASFGKITYPCRIGSVRSDSMPLFAVMFSVFSVFKDKKI